MPSDTVMVWTRGAINMALSPSEAFLFFILLATGGTVWVSRGWAIVMRWWQVVQSKLDEEFEQSQRGDARTERIVRRVTG